MKAGESMNPYIPTSNKWYEFELNNKYPGEPVKPSRGYKFWVGKRLIDCKDNDVNKWVVVK